MRVCLDSNILVYAIDENAGEKRVVAKDLIRRASAAGGILALQSLGEFFFVARRKALAEMAHAQFLISKWRAAFPIHAATEDSLEAAMGAVIEHNLSFWDAMIWAVAQEAGCDLLVSEDFQDGRCVGGVLFVDPFNEANGALLDAALRVQA